MKLIEKRYALITGASGGIGSSYAMQLAAMGFNLILTSRKKFEVDFLKNTLSKKYNIDVKVVIGDLTKKSDRTKLVTLAKKVDGLTLLINNAGFGIGSQFVETDSDYLNDMVALHNVATVDLTKQLLPLLLKQKKSYIVNVASLAAFFPFVHSVVYSATKSFLVSFSEGLHLELKKNGVRVQALCPGFTKTHFFDSNTKANKEVLQRKRIFWMTPNKVVKKSINDLIRKKNNVICIPGFPNRVMRCLGFLLPKRLYYFFMKLR